MIQEPLTGGVGSTGIGDVDLDVDLDLVVGDEDAFLLLTNQGEGFTSGATAVEADTALSAALVDRSGSGVLDLALGGVDQIAYLNGDGSGGFDAPGVVVPITHPAYQLRGADFNGDGLVDLAVSGVDQLSVLFANGEGGFDADFSALGVGWGAAVGPFASPNGSDLVLADSDANSLSLYENRSGQLVLTGLRSFGGGLEVAWRVHDGDVDGDGQTDLVLASLEDGGVTVGIRGGEPLPVLLQRFDTPGVLGRTVRVGDLNGDGVQDFVIGAIDFEFGIVFGVGVVSECAADLDGSNSVDSVDLNILLADFGCVGGGCTGDVDGDGDTDSADLNAVLVVFGEECQ
jgi:hypothetical protein